MQAHFTEACSFRYSLLSSRGTNPTTPASSMDYYVVSRECTHACAALPLLPFHHHCHAAGATDPALKTGALTIAQAYVGKFSPAVELCQLFLLGSSPASSCRHSPAILRCRAILLRHLPKREREAGRVGRCAEPVAVLCQPLAQLLRRQDERPDGRE
jgi:hypothetical protein